jgi:hypothetical protein
MLPVGVTIRPATDKDVRRIYRECRDQDRLEMRAQDVHGESQAVSRCRCFTQLWAGCFNDRPIAVFGHLNTATETYFSFFGSPRADHLWGFITRYARGYIDDRQSENPGLRQSVQVHEENLIPIRWLEHLGFVRTDTHWDTPHGRLIKMERVNTLD